MSDYGSTPPPPPPPPPPYGGYGVQAAPPPNYLVWAILSTIFCFPPLGIASIVFAAQVNSKWAIGDVAGAQRASELTKKLTIWTVVVGVILNVLALVAIFAFGAFLGTTSSVNVN
jgi:Interferon-induced transmembrane protein